MDNALNIKNNVDSQTTNISKTIKPFDNESKVVSASKQKINSRYTNKTGISLQNLKTFSQEKVKIHLDTISNTDKSLNHNSHSHSSTKGYLFLFLSNTLIFFNSIVKEPGKLNHEVLNRIYNNNLLKSTTPKYLNSKGGTINSTKESLMTSKNGFFKSYNNDSYPTPNGPSHHKVKSNNLYQKAKNEVLNGKLELSSTKPGKKFPNSAFHTNVQPTKRDESPSKEELQKFVLSNLYSPSHENKMSGGDKSFFNASTKLSKKNSVKALYIVSPPKRVGNEKNLIIQPSTSQNISQEKFFKKPLFKLDLSKRTPSNR